jgi:hypothetical protein
MRISEVLGRILLFSPEAYSAGIFFNPAGPLVSETVQTDGRLLLLIRVNLVHGGAL